MTLMDLDFNCGAIDFMLKLPYDQGLSHVTGFGARIDESIWARVVSKVGSLDVMRSGSQEGRRITAREIEHLLAFAGSHKG